MAYDLYLGKVLLPVTPSSIKTEIDNKNKTIELINEGEVNVLKNAGLTKITFSLLLPNVQYSFARYPDGFKNAAYYLKVLEDYKVERKPFQFILTRILPTGNVLFYTNLKVSLESYTIEDDVSEGFDTKVSITLKQYKAYGTKTVSIASQVGTVLKRDAGAGADTAATKYIIVKGDTLWNIAKLKLGNGSRWVEIYNTNKEVIESTARERGKGGSNNGQWIFPGTVIIIPEGSATDGTSSEKFSFGNKTIGVYKGTGGSKTNSPFTILTNTYNIVKANFNSWNAVIGYYEANGGRGKKWKIADADKRLVDL